MDDWSQQIIYTIASFWKLSREKITLMFYIFHTNASIHVMNLNKKKSSIEMKIIFPLTPKNSK